MAYVSKNGIYSGVNIGCSKCKIISYQPNGKKVVKSGKVFNQGYITFELEDGTLVKQYLLIAPWNTFLFYKLIKSTKDEFNIINECNNFDYTQIIGKEVVIEIDGGFNGITPYYDVTNIYNIEEGEKIIEYENSQRELGF
ncbi:TPA: hypothetical protein I9Z34_002344 [Clostridium perfringens]|nr:hypothetical protein [Clostridium perfringens]